MHRTVHTGEDGAGIDATVDLHHMTAGIARMPSCTPPDRAEVCADVAYVPPHGRERAVREACRGGERR